MRNEATFTNEITPINQILCVLTTKHYMTALDYVVGLQNAAVSIRDSALARTLQKIHFQNKRKTKLRHSNAGRSTFKSATSFPVSPSAPTLEF